MTTLKISEAIEWEQHLAERLGASDGLDDARGIFLEMCLARSGDRLPSDTKIEAVEADGFAAEWITTADAAADTVILYIHGGGFTFGGPQNDRETMARLGHLSGARVLAVDYRLAPEHPRPAARDDSLSAYSWLLDKGIQPQNIVILGESAGGALVLDTLFAARAAGIPLPAAAVLWSPFVDFTVSGESMETNKDRDPFVGKAAASGAAAAYLQGQDPLAASPLFGDLSGLPPMLVQVGTNEAFLDDARRLVESATRAGSTATLDLWDDVVHMWHGFPTLPAAIAATERAAKFVADQIR